MAKPGSQRSQEWRLRKKLRKLSEGPSRFYCDEDFVRMGEALAEDDWLPPGDVTNPKAVQEAFEQMARGFVLAKLGPPPDIAEDVTNQFVTRASRLGKSGV